MKMFILRLKDKDISIVCDWKNTRNGFKHEAILLIDGTERDRAKICYLNRTWESWEFESAIKELLYKTDKLTDKEKARFRKKFDLETG